MGKRISLFIGYFILLIAASISEYLYYKTTLESFKPLNNFDLFIFIWLLIPYLLMGYILTRHLGLEHKLAHDRSDLTNWQRATYNRQMDVKSILIVSIIGVYISAEVLYFHRDGWGIVLILPLVPLLQLIIFFIHSLINKARRRKFEDE